MTRTTRDQFPIFGKNPNLVYLDNGATTLKPQAVVDKMNRYYTEYSANIHRGVYDMSEKATTEYEAARDLVAKFIGADRNEVVFTRGTTESINMVAGGWGEENIGQGDEIVVSEMEHHSNLVPWQVLAKKKKAELKYIPVLNGILDQSRLEELVTRQTKILALTQVSNVLGTVNPIKEIVKKVKKINPEITVVVDGAQAVAHMPVEMGDLGCDFYAFSGHKMYGPTGIGVLWGRKELLEVMNPLNYGGGMIREVTKTDSRWAEIPDKFEGGTPPIAEAIGLGAAVEFILGLGWSNVVEQESETLKYALDRLTKVKGLTVAGHDLATDRVGVAAFSLEGVHPHDAASVLAAEGVCVRAGHHCAMPLHQVLGLMATTRMSLGVYNGWEDVDRLVKALEKCRVIFGTKVRVK